MSEFHVQTRPVAAKDYYCGRCDWFIPTGTQHVKAVYKHYTDDRLRSVRLCYRCADPSPLPERVSQEQLEDELRAWNAAHPVGTLVRYWTGVREGEGRTGKTRSAAELLGGHTPSVWVTGLVGCVALSHVEVIG